MKPDLYQRLLKVFEAEHAEHLAAIRHFLDCAAQAVVSEAELNEAFRRAHSLKGAAQAVDLPLVKNLGHQLETLLAGVRDQLWPLDDSLQQLIHQSLDLSEDWLQAQTHQETAPNPEPVLQALEHFLAAQPQPVSAEEPSVPRPEPAAISQAPVAQASSVALPEPVASLAPKLAESESLRISAQRLEALLQTAEQIQLTCQRQQASVLDLQTLKHWVRVMAESEQRDVALEAAQTLIKSVQQSQYQQAALNWELGEQNAQLQQAIREIRMLPAQQLFQVFPKMVRELAQAQGKQVHCQFTGLELEVDRAILQALKDPVMHILRNAVAHGIERPEVRLSQGKPAQGNIGCHLQVQGHHLRICIRDDGQGLDPQRIQAQLRTQTAPQDWQTAIFQAGFSTANGVNDLRGRGMGLSVVAETVARLQGSYRLLPTPAGGGLSLELEVPLSIATYHLLLVSCAGETFALPAYAVQQVLKVPITALQTREGQAHLQLGAEFLPCHSLSQLLFQKPLPPLTALPVLRLKTSQGPLALLVEKILGDQQSVLKPLTGPASHLPHYLGAVLSAQGLPIPVLNPQYLTQKAQQQTQQSLPITPHDLTPAPLILVVDDSITTRTLEQSILETHGYRVQVAVNGREALQMLQAEAFELVVTDLQMPEMDGLELLQAIKQDPALQQIPVIVVTSVDADEDRSRGLELGAAAYLVKQKFDQQELLEAVQNLL